MWFSRTGLFRNTCFRTLTYAVERDSFNNKGVLGHPLWNLVWSLIMIGIFAWKVYWQTNSHELSGKCLRQVFTVRGKKANSIALVSCYLFHDRKGSTENTSQVNHLVIEFVVLYLTSVD